MAQPSVAREPSMEEILASIRKIIESNEPGASKSISASLPPVYAASNDDEGGIHLTVDDEFDTVAIDDVPPSVSTLVDPRFVAANSPGAVRQSEGGERTMSLADVAARVRAASERTATQAGPSREAPPPRELPAAMVARFAEVRREPIAPPPVRSVVPDELTAVPFAPVMPRLVEAPIAMAVDVAQPIEDEFPSAVQQQAPAEEIETEIPAEAEAPALRDAYVEDHELPELRIEAPQLLISEAAGQQVARSFEDLVAAVDGASQRRSLDEIAQDMLRPMLQEWLDDNLPTLVERLVREEIERVARGPRR